MFIVYNCGHAVHLTITAKSGKKYRFMRRFVTEVDDEDANYFLKKTSRAISWCPNHPKSIQPFVELNEWCSGKVERCYEPKSKKDSNKVYDPKAYKKACLVKDREGIQ